MKKITGLVAALAIITVAAGCSCTGVTPEPPLNISTTTSATESDTTTTTTTPENNSRDTDNTVPTTIETDEELTTTVPPEVTDDEAEVTTPENEEPIDSDETVTTEDTEAETEELPEDTTSGTTTSQTTTKPETTTTPQTTTKPVTTTPKTTTPATAVTTTKVNTTTTVTTTKATTTTTRATTTTKTTTTTKVTTTTKATTTTVATPAIDLNAVNDYSVDPNYSSSLNPPTKLTESQIKNMYKTLKYDFSATTYTSMPSSTAPYKAGVVSDASLNSALNAMNFVRYVAGIPYNVKLKDEYIEYTQYAAVVNAANGSLSHYPDKPSGMSDDFYSIGKTGASSSNIAMGYSSLASSIITGYMDDSDSSNIAIVGHRRWILNPAMQYTGFGMCGRYSALYAFDNSFGKHSYDFVCWPAQNMPVELYYGNAFSVSFASAEYDALDPSKIKVTMTHRNTGDVVVLSKGSSGNGKHFSVDNNYYGMNRCVIFRPSYTQYVAGDVVDIEITGLTKNGVSKSLKYTVRFFEMT